MTTIIPTIEELDLVKTTAASLGLEHVVVCMGGLSVHVNGQPYFGCKVYGPFTEDEVGERAREILRIEGGAILVRPLVDLQDTYRRLSAD